MFVRKPKSSPTTDASPSDKDKDKDSTAQETGLGSVSRGTFAALEPATPSDSSYVFVDNSNVPPLPPSSGLNSLVITSLESNNNDDEEKMRWIPEPPVSPAAAAAMRLRYVSY